MYFTCTRSNTTAHHFAKIFLENRFKNSVQGDNVFITVDCTNLTIKEKRPFNAVYFSHKSNGPAYKYEVAVSIKGGDIVWVSGPWPAAIKDKKIFKLHLAKHLGENERAEVDNGYRQTAKAAVPAAGETFLHKKGKAQAQSRQEIHNGLFKCFHSLQDRFRELDPEKHCLAFNAVAILTQLSKDHGEQLYDVSVVGKYH